jgi:hypothetical protein
MATGSGLASPAMQPAGQQASVSQWQFATSTPQSSMGGAISQPRGAGAPASTRAAGIQPPSSELGGSFLRSHMLSTGNRNGLTGSSALLPPSAAKDVAPVRVSSYARNMGSSTVSTPGAPPTVSPAPSNCFWQHQGPANAAQSAYYNSLQQLQQNVGSTASSSSPYSLGAGAAKHRRGLAWPAGRTGIMARQFLDDSLRRQLAAGSYSVQAQVRTFY